MSYLLLHGTEKDISTSSALVTACISFSSGRLPVGSRFCATDPLHRMGSCHVKNLPKKQSQTNFPQKPRDKQTGRHTVRMGRVRRFRGSICNSGTVHRLQTWVSNMAVPCSQSQLKSSCGTKEMEALSVLRSISWMFTPECRAVNSIGSNRGATKLGRQILLGQNNHCLSIRYETSGHPP